MLKLLSHFIVLCLDQLSISETLCHPQSVCSASFKGHNKGDPAALQPTQGLCSLSAWTFVLSPHKPILSHHYTPTKADSAITQLSDKLFQFQTSAHPSFIRASD